MLEDVLEESEGFEPSWHAKASATFEIGPINQTPPTFLA